MNWEPRLDRAGASSFSLGRVDALLRAFGNPDDKMRFAHVAGTKGKGSTALFLAEILRAAGYRTGLYTSPHLYTLNERIRVLEPGAPLEGGIFEGAISEEDLVERVRFYEEPVAYLRAGMDEEVTYFEYLTVLAVSYFAHKACQFVVLETGLGGRLDATNIFETSVCGITPIGSDHKHILGDTLPAIAAEKAGIIKSPDQRVALAAQAPEVMKVFDAACARFGISPTVVGKGLGLKVTARHEHGTVFDVTGRREYRGLATRLLGEHQAANAALAIAMAEDLEGFGTLITEPAVREGIARAQWPCRFELFDGEPRIIVDAAHTPESAAACVEALTALFPGKKAVLLFGVSADKDIQGICQALAPAVTQVVMTQASSPRAFVFTVSNARGYFKDTVTSVVPDAAIALGEARRLAGSDGIVLVAGSIFLAAEVRALVQGA
jgi:dihydrofolate synthase/folylpolyglutamate synthase